jgi:predicted aconitase with swiveling domain
MGKMMLMIHGTPLVPGAATGIALCSDVPISFWGGLRPETGEIIDRQHPLCGQIVTGRVLVIPSGRGSCSASGVLLEAIHNATAPAGIIVSTVDPIIGLGSILGGELYGKVVPVILVTARDRKTIASHHLVMIAPSGSIVIRCAKSDLPGNDL